jgi:hypothetical protein
MAGVVSHRATTTIKVVDREELDPNSYFMLILDGLKDQGYVTEELMTIRDVHEWVDDLTDELMFMAGALPEGTVVERRGDYISVRQHPAEP